MVNTVAASTTSSTPRMINCVRRVMLCSPEIRPEQHIQANLPHGAYACSRSKREAVENIKIVGMFQFIQGLNQAVIVSLNGRRDIHLHQAARVWRMLMKGNRVRPQSRQTRQISQVLADRGISRPGGMKMSREKFVPLFLIGRQ